MSIFTVVQQNATGTTGSLEAAVRTSGFPSYPVAPGVWLVSYDGTAMSLCAALGITPDGTHGTAIVTEVSSYYGRANPAIWTWFKNNWQGGALG